MALGLPFDEYYSLTFTHVHHSHDIALVDQGGTRPTSGCVHLTNIYTLAS